jgi:hypothetical protein
MEKGVDVEGVALKHNSVDIAEEGLGYKPRRRSGLGNGETKESRQGWRVNLYFMR